MNTSKSLALALTLGGAFACSDPSAPRGDNTVTIDLCGDIGPLGWFAYQNEGGPWTRLTPDANNQLVFDATEKVSLAMGFSFFGANVTQITNATASELQAGFDLPCEDAAFADRHMNGTVLGITGEQFARISAATEVTSVGASSPAWELDFLPAKPVDIVATRRATAFTEPSSRVLVRRAVMPANASIPALDFNSVESANVEPAMATLASVPINGTLELQSQVLTKNGTEHVMGRMATTAGSATTVNANFVSLPASLRLDTDIHELTATASTADGTFQVQHFYKTPGAKTLAFGPLVSEPTITNVATTPYVRPRLQLAAQAAYPSGVAALFMDSDEEDSSWLVMVMTTRGFAGELPSTWDVTVPDMSAAGYMASWGLPTTSYNWNVIAYSTNHPDGVLATAPVDGTTITSALRARELIFAAAGSPATFLARARHAARLKQLTR